MASGVVPVPGGAEGFSEIVMNRMVRRLGNGGAYVTIHS